MTVFLEITEDQTVSARALILRALGRLGVTTPTEEPNAEDVQHAFEELNEMLSQWAAQSLLVPSVQRLALALVGGQSTYTVGYGGDLEMVPRPVNIDQGLTLDSSGVTFTVAPLTDAQFAEITFKSTSGRPEFFHYNSAGEIEFFPVPDAPYTLSVPIGIPLTYFAEYTQEVTVPSGYEAALSWSLAELLMPNYGRDIRAVSRNAKRFRDAIKRRRIDNTFWSRTTQPWNILNNAY